MSRTIIPPAPACSRDWSKASPPAAAATFRCACASRAVAGHLWSGRSAECRAPAFAQAPHCAHAQAESGIDHARKPANRAWSERPPWCGRGKKCPISASPKFPSTRTSGHCPRQAPATNALVDGPILRTLLWLAWPNVIALSAGTCVVIAETSYIGRLGVESLAAMALVFPFVILTMTMSGGAMGGGVASAIARALGAGDTDRASTLAAHALLIGLAIRLCSLLVATIPLLSITNLHIGAFITPNLSSFRTHSIKPYQGVRHRYFWESCPYWVWFSISRSWNFTNRKEPITT